MVGILTSAQDKTDKTASKEWGFRTDLSFVCDMAAHGWWKYYAPESDQSIGWWGITDFVAAGDQRMVFSADGNKLTTFDATGAVKNEGTFEVSHEQPEDGVMGMLKTTVPVIGSEFDESGISENNFYILTLTEQYMTIYHAPASPPGDWADASWRVVYEAQ